MTGHNDPGASHENASLSQRGILMPECFVPISLRGRLPSREEEYEIFDYGLKHLSLKEGILELGL